MQTASFINTVYGLSTNPAPEVGMGATLCFWTDRRAGTVIAVTPKTLTVREDRAIRTDGYGMSDCQTYRYEPNEEGRIYEFSLRKNGRWVQRGYSIGSGTILRLGSRETYHDYGF